MSFVDRLICGLIEWNAKATHIRESNAKMYSHESEK